MIPQHVEHAHRRQSGTEKIRSLSDDGAHEEAAVAAALDRQLRRRGVAVGYQPLGRGDEIVENVLFLELGAGHVPLAAVLTTTAEIGDHQYAAHLEPHHAGRAVGRRAGTVEAAVAIEKGGVLPVESEASLVDDEHRHPGAVLALEEDLLRLITGEVDRRLGAREKSALTRIHCKAVDRRRSREVGVGEKGFWVVAVT